MMRTHTNSATVRSVDTFVGGSGPFSPFSSVQWKESAVRRMRLLFLGYDVGRHIVLDDQVKMIQSESNE